MGKIGFEEALKRLEEIAGILEKGDTSLDEALRLFEEGMKLSAFCQKKLTEVENKIKLIVQKEGEINLEEFKS
ncbi:MAG: exodeoxyribonuclease VII small subunit [Desulfurellaceae bacterium]|jgi:exodeoxyribonuclease VII small subunit|nr:exodeoxyribonuclease VII small subunit [Desulfurellaceae bacterium]